MLAPYAPTCLQHARRPLVLLNVNLRREALFAEQAVVEGHPSRLLSMPQEVQGLYTREYRRHGGDVAMLANDWPAVALSHVTHRQLRSIRLLQLVYEQAPANSF